MGRRTRSGGSSTARRRCTGAVLASPEPERGQFICAVTGQSGRFAIDEKNTISLAVTISDPPALLRIPPRSSAPLAEHRHPVVNLLGGNE